MTRFCDEALPESSIFVVLHRERERLFPDEMFADVFSDKGRRSVPPSVVATVMVLQRLEGLSDRDAVQRYTFDARWRYAAGVGGYDGTGWDRFTHTVLVDMRARLATSGDPRRIFTVTLDAASKAGLVGVKRVLDSTPLYDAVATMDTITLIRSAVRGLLRVAGTELEAELRGVISSGDDYASNAKPHIDWDDAAARDALIDSQARDGQACLALLGGRKLGKEVDQASQLLATVLGQDLETTDDGAFRIAQRVAKDRVISTVDPQARHGHKTVARGFDGYKGHAAIDPDSEIITDTVVSAGNVGDATVAADLIDDLTGTTDTATTDTAEGGGETDEPAVYGDASYGTGEFLDQLANHDIAARCKTQAPTASGGMFTKDRFDVDLDTDTVTCPNGATAPIRRNNGGDGIAYFGDTCRDCPLRVQCTKAQGGRTVNVGRYEHRLSHTRAQQQDPRWVADYRATRPKVERKLAHLMRHHHGGRRARMRGTTKIDADFNLLAAAHNLARLARLGLRFTATGWVTATP
ncbi:MAG TPA: IS1182 family transposase [Actinophytocola sp.]|uniref:IS1182 family transposase n=1 Tax=Actinophytocola sp. TaxID=1872138 RepID=UPI002DDD95FC|nr:IS1182 family transposase [Actinophytocola sp.]HEV2782931.1 IS1182 family transposase [Actinophytocola sp.]